MILTVTQAFLSFLCFGTTRIPRIPTLFSGTTFELFGIDGYHVATLDQITIAYNNYPPWIRIDGDNNVDKRTMEGTKKHMYNYTNIITFFSVFE